MKHSKISHYFKAGVATVAGILAAVLFTGFPSDAQTPAGKATPATPASKAAPATKGTNTGKQPAIPTAQKGKGAPAPAKPTTQAPTSTATSNTAPLTEADIQRLWMRGSAEYMLNEMRLRKLVFEPDEEWLAGLAKPPIAPEMSAVVSELQRQIPPAPDVDDVSKQSADLFARLKVAAQSRDQNAVAALVHPILLENKSKVYDLFDTTNYRNHSLGRFTKGENRTVAVQFFQLTSGQVERLHYVKFATSRGKVVVRDIESAETKPELADRFMRDEQELAKRKLDQVFRALNDGDQGALKSLCTPGLYDSLQELAGERQAGGARLIRGRYVPVAQLPIKISAPLDFKSMRVVVRVTITSARGKQIEFDTDFERIDNDLKVVRLRDVKNKVIAWDPNIDNYLNRRYGLVDGPAQTEPPTGRTEFPYFQPLSKIKEYALNALDSFNPQLLDDYAEEFVDSEPTGGAGPGFRAAVLMLQGKAVDAEKSALMAIERNGTVYLPVLRHRNFNNQSLAPVTLAISKDRIQYMPPMGQGDQPEDIPLASIESLLFEKGNLLNKPRPFISLQFKGPDGKKKEYNFAAWGTTCPDDPNKQATLTSWPQGTICNVVDGNAQRTNIPGTPIPIGGTKTAPMLVPREWQSMLNVVIRTVAEARKGGQPANTKKGR